MNFERNPNIPWVEKYRPKKFEKIVLDPLNRTLFENIIEYNYFPNMLYYGPPGTGKTTTIINLINEFQMKNYAINKNLILHLNASDERGIDIIRNQIYQFVKTKNMFENGLKFVILDEVDYMTKCAQQALKCLLQNCSQNIRFCLICNYISKIEDTLQNEFLCIRFNQLPKHDIFEFIQNITNAENIQIPDNSIQILQEIYKSDIRCMINFIQLNQTLSLNEWENKLINYIIMEKMYEMRGSPKLLQKYIYEISFQYNLDIKSILLFFFYFIIKKKPELITNKLLNIIKNIFHTTELLTDDIVLYFVTHIKIETI